jgi:hypothetical protein
VVDVGMREDDRINIFDVEGKFQVAFVEIFTPALVQPTIQKQLIIIDLK